MPLPDQDQTNSKSESSHESTPLLIAEYNSLREEILKRIDAMNQINALALIAPGTILAYGLQNHNATLLLLYPLLAMFLSISWSINDRRTRELGYYIQTQIEEKFGKGYTGWEHFMNLTRGKNRFFDMDNIFATIGIFLGTEGLSVLIGWTLAIKSGSILPLYVLLAIALISIILTFAALLRPYHHEKRIEEYTITGQAKQNE